MKTMAKEKATALKSYQHEISKADWEKAVLAMDRAVGYSSVLKKYYRTDMSDKNYLKHLEARKKSKQDKRAKSREVAFTRGFNKGKKEGVKEFKASEAMKKIKQASFNHGVKAAKPKVNASERIAKQKARLSEKIKALEQKEAKLKK
jgi:hypothetical protein